MRKALIAAALLAVLSPISFAANEARFNDCRSKLLAAQKLDVFTSLDYKSGPPTVTICPTFYTLPFHAKQGFAETVNCLLNQGNDTYINFDMLDWRTNKVVAKWSYGKVKMK